MVVLAVLPGDSGTSSVRGQSAAEIPSSSTHPSRPQTSDSKSQRPAFYNPNKEGLKKSGFNYMNNCNSFVHFYMSLDRIKNYCTVL